MAFKRLISIGVKSYILQKQNKTIEYNIFLTKNGIRIKKLIKHRERRNAHKRIFFKFFKNTDKKERVKVASASHSKLIFHKAEKMKREKSPNHNIQTKIEENTQTDLINKMNLLSLKRKMPLAVGEGTKKRRTL